MTAPGQPAILKCPVCGAAFRGSAICSRCSTDLAPLMRIAVKAWDARQQARRHLHSGDLRSAMRCSTAAWKLHHSGPRPVPIEPPAQAISAKEKRGPEEPCRAESPTGAEAGDGAEADNRTETRDVTAPIVFPTNFKKRVTGQVQLFLRRLLKGKRRDNY
jgi:hypothetical protein